MFVGNIRHVCHTSRETKCLPVISARLPIMADSKKAKHMAEKPLDGARRRQPALPAPALSARLIMKKMIPLDVIRLSEPATTAALDATQKAVRDRYASQIQAALAEMQIILAGRAPRSLKGTVAIAYMAAKTHFDALIMEQKCFAEAELTRRLAEASSDPSVAS